MGQKESRIFGLDALRAAAILLVVVSHVLGINTTMHQSRAVAFCGIMGVELFFVLSGFLIGGIIIRLMHANRFNTYKDLFHFWLNRWFRTLPLYYFFFFLYCFFHGHFFSQIHQHASYLVFMQNLAWNMPVDFFGQSWSLSIEEWFYLAFPLFLFGLYAVLRLPMRSSVLIAAFLFMAASLVLRIIHSPENSFLDFDQTIRKWVVFRFDALMLGVLMAYIKYEKPRLWHTLSSRSALAFIFLGFVSLFLAFAVQFLFVLPWLQVMIFPIVSLSVALVMPFFADWKNSHSLLQKPVVGLAKSSYSIYLSHAIPVTGIAKFPQLYHDAWIVSV